MAVLFRFLGSTLGGYAVAAVGMLAIGFYCALLRAEVAALKADKVILKANVATLEGVVESERETRRVTEGLLAGQQEINRDITQSLEDAHGRHLAAMHANAALERQLGAAIRDRPVRAAADARARLDGLLGDFWRPRAADTGEAHSDRPQSGAGGPAGDGAPPPDAGSDRDQQ